MKWKGQTFKETGILPTSGSITQLELDFSHTITSSVLLLPADLRHNNTGLQKIVIEEIIKHENYKITKILVWKSQQAKISFHKHTAPLPLLPHPQNSLSIHHMTGISAQPHSRTSNKDKRIFTTGHVDL